MRVISSRGLFYVLCACCAFVFFLNTNFLVPFPPVEEEAYAQVCTLSSPFTSACSFGMERGSKKNFSYPPQAEAQKEKDEAEVQVNCILSAAAEIPFIFDSL